MTLKEFRSLNKEDQYIALWDKADLVADRESEYNKYILYQLDSFYIELRLAKYDFNEEIRAFSKDRRLKPYLDAIDLGSLDEILVLNK